MAFPTAYQSRLRGWTPQLQLVRTKEQVWTWESRRRGKESNVRFCVFLQLRKSSREGDLLVPKQVGVQGCRVDSFLLGEWGSGRLGVVRV